jgi:integrase/recombinase XerD
MDRHAGTRRLRRLAETAGVRTTRPHPHILRHTFVITMRYDRARKNLDRHPNCISAAYMASGI